MVADLLSPAADDPLALAIGAVGPCLSAPVFEEVLYRGFLLPSMLRFGVPLRRALPLHAVLFAAHHVPPPVQPSPATLLLCRPFCRLGSNSARASTPLAPCPNARAIGFP